MPRPPLPPDALSTPSFVKPLLHALDRLQERETLRPAQLTERARALLHEHFASTAAPVEAAFAHGSLSLLGDHTHYFDGFALMRPMARGMAVAVRAAGGPASQVALEGRGRWSFAPDAPPASVEDAPRLARVVATLAQRLNPPGQGVEVAIVGTVPPCCMEARLGATGMAAAHALQALLARPDDAATLSATVRATLAEVTGYPFSIAYLLAGPADPADAFVLADTHTLEHLPVAVPGHEKLGWGLLATPPPAGLDPAHEWRRVERIEDALAVLRRKGFPELASLRDLEHPDLPRALEVLPRRHRPLVRHLVTENRRVPQLIRAVRRRDWQKFGALLLMSHASQRNDWGSTSPEADFIVEQVGSMSLEGLYGGHMTGRGGSVLIVGQPFLIPPALDRIQTAFEARFGTVPDALLL